MVSSSHCPVEVFDAQIPGSELAVAVERLNARAVVLYSSKPLNLQHLPKLLSAITCPVLIAGPSVSIHNDELAVSSAESAALSLAKDPIEAHQRLSQLRLF